MFLPTTKEDLNKRGWDCCDVIIVTPDAYADHPSFAMSILGRFLEKNGYKTGIISQPKWKDPKSFMKLGIPKIAFAVSGGQMDSMVLNYTSARIPRKEDLFCENKNPYFSSIGDKKKYRIRPDRCINVYCSQIKAACKDKPVIIGGIEASLRRIAHYDFWSDKIKRSILFDAKADILIYGMGEYPLLNVVRALERGESPENIKTESTAVIRKDISDLKGYVLLPSFKEVSEDRESFARAHILFEDNDNKKTVVQKQDSRYLVQYPGMEITQDQLDYIYDTDFERKIHPDFKNVPAFDMIKTSVTSHRGCYGDCSFCAIANHQGKKVVSRSKQSILNEIRVIASKKDFPGTITDIGGPTANMYASGCRIGGCETNDCLKGPKGCRNFIPGNREYLDLLSEAKKIDNVKNIQINSGLRFDSCIMDDNFLREILRHYISGQMKIAPESGSDPVLHYMNKPDTKVFESFIKKFERIKKEEGIKKYIIPYIITGHPGEGEKELKQTRDLLRKNRLSGKQFQIFTPTPMTRSAAMYYLGYDPRTGEKIGVEKDVKTLRKRKDVLMS
ncbi:putative radical SAM protein YgiQ [Methanomicrobium sp. W14]|uniref:YgiQ family radical SAM protein n=1 Tax=Methanomicrobium sp. W14 TaxID=2817839 RepID=UPI001AE8BC57|nr:YgiQ family radical SAM protein [Methanomicrobium sp. W14]MBP2132544.1 putative radical SAM protein YgiQ [Methanomicrobium sp. W14]